MWRRWAIEETKKIKLTKNIHWELDIHLMNPAKIVRLPIMARMLTPK
jgi:hypothetical protein